LPIAENRLRPNPAYMVTLFYTLKDQ